MAALPSPSEVAVRGAPVRLRNGSHVQLRQLHRSDRELLRITAQADASVPLSARLGSG